MSATRIPSQTAVPNSILHSSKKRNGALLAAALAGAAAGYALFVRPWHLRWGATTAEIARPLPGDELVPRPSMAATHAVTIAVPVECVWSWIAQIGQGRGGFYSYDWLENLLGMDIHNTDRLDPALQNLQVGDLVPFSKAAGVPVVRVEPPGLLILAGSLYSPGESGEPAGETGGSWAFVLERRDPATTRLILRTRVASFDPPWFSTLAYRLLLEPAHFVMERKMLLGIKARAEASTRPAGSRLAASPLWQRLRGVNQRMARNYARGFGPRGLVLLLTTTGRKTGLPRVTPLQYEQQAGIFYVASARGREADWVRNILANPQVQIRTGDRLFAGLAEVIDDPARIADFLELRLCRHPLMMRLLLLAEGLPPWFDRARLERFAREKVVVAIRPCEPLVLAKERPEFRNIPG